MPDAEAHPFSQQILLDRDAAEFISLVIIHVVMMMTVSAMGMAMRGFFLGR